LKKNVPSRKLSEKISQKLKRKYKLSQSGKLKVRQENRANTRNFQLKINTDSDEKASIIFYVDREGGGGIAKKGKDMEKKGKSPTNGEDDQKERNHKLT